MRKKENRKGESPDVSERGIVLIKEKSLPRVLGKLGKIIRVIRSPGGVPKGAELKTADGTLILLTLNRLYDKLHPWGCSESQLRQHQSYLACEQ